MECDMFSSLWNISYFYRFHLKCSYNISLTWRLIQFGTTKFENDANRQFDLSCFMHFSNFQPVSFCNFLVLLVNLHLPILSKFSLIWTFCLVDFRIQHELHDSMTSRQYFEDSVRPPHCCFPPSSPSLIQIMIIND